MCLLLVLVCVQYNIVNDGPEKIWPSGRRIILGIEDMILGNTFLVEFVALNLSSAVYFSFASYKLLHKNEFYSVYTLE